jgi:hypothetical protein
MKGLALQTRNALLADVKSANWNGGERSFMPAAGGQIFRVIPLHPDTFQFPIVYRKDREIELAVNSAIKGCPRRL